MRAGANLTCLALALGALGCAHPGISGAELPEEPLALVYFTHRQAERRADLVRDQQSPASGGRQAPRDAAARARANPAEDSARSTVSRRPSATRAVREGVASAEGMSALLTGLLGVAGGGDAPERGRLALLEPRTGRIEVLSGVRPGAVPQAWSRDHRRLLYTQASRDQLQLFEYDRETGETRQVTRGPLAHPEGCYGPADRLVVMSIDPREAQPVAQIQLTEPGGGSPKSISSGFLDHSPACAPDGSAIAYTSTLRGGAERVVVQRPVVEGTPRILGKGRDPAFSHDGQWIAYSAPEKRSWKIWRVRADGSGRAPVGRGTLEERRPAIAPGGGFVAYIAGDEYRRTLYVRRFEGGGERILLSSGDGESPVW